MARITEEEFKVVWFQKGCSPIRVAEHFDIDISNVYARRKRLAAKGIILPTIPADGNATGANGYGSADWQVPLSPYRQRLDYTVRDGYAFFFGDAHYHPGEPSLAHEALVLLAKRLKPKFMAANGDIFDGASISRHEPLGWHKIPTVREEIDICKTRLGEIERASPDSEKFYSPGNHCTRLDRRLATENPEFAGVEGFKLEDHLKGWPMAYVGVINADTDVPVLVMHNFRGGVHAPWNNAIHAGATIVTGHLHSQDIKAHTTYFKTCYGVDHGMLADPRHEAFSYTMGRPTNWRAGFCVIPFDKQGRHYRPEFCEVQSFKDGYLRATFRGETLLERCPKELTKAPSRVKSKRQAA